MELRPSILAVAVVALALVAPTSAHGASLRLATHDEPLHAARTLAGGERLLPSRPAPFGFELIGLHWRGSGAISVRTRLAGGAWSPWREVDADAGPDRASVEASRRSGWHVGEGVWVARSDELQIRIAGPVDAVRSFVVHSPERPLRRLSLVGTPGIIPRAAWGADESIVRAAPYYADRVDLAVVHHTAGRSPTTPEESAALVRAVQAYHVKGNGWNDIGYNFVVDPFGQVFEGRGGGVEANVVGAHVRGFNTGTFGVALLGNFDEAAVTPEARAALVRLLAWRLDVAHVDPISLATVVSSGGDRYAAGIPATVRAISGHRDLGLTACPGANLYAELAGIAQEVDAIGGPRLFAPAAAPAGLRPLPDGDVEPIRFTARLSEPRDWSVTILDETGALLARGEGFGDAVDWTWDGRDRGDRQVAFDARLSAAFEAGADIRPATVDLADAPPSLRVSGLAVRPRTISPNGDGRGDSAAVAFTLTQEAIVTAKVQDASGTPVVTLLDALRVPSGPAQTTWDGFSADGSLAPDGRYRVVVSVRADDGQGAVATAGLVVDRSLVGLASAAALSPNGDGRLDRLPISFTLGRAAVVRVRVRRGSSWVARVHGGELGPGLHALSWDGATGKGRARDGRYTVVVEATTDLGTVTEQRSFVLDATPPRLVLTASWSRRHSTKLAFRLSEAARVKVWLDGLAVSVERDAGPGGFWTRGQVSRARVVAWDAAGNRSEPVLVRFGRAR